MTNNNNNNIDIEKTEYVFPKDNHPKPYHMTIRVPIHNYMVSKRVKDPPWIKLSKDDLQHMFNQIAQELGYDMTSLNYTKTMTADYNKITQTFIEKMLKQIHQQQQQP